MDSERKKTVYALVGPSCTYKSKIAIELAEKLPFEIISADSRLVYKGMNIGTSKPTYDEMKDVPHYLIDLVEPGSDFTVGLYKRESEKLIKDIFAKGQMPLFVGGTGLYLNSVLLGLSIPEVKPDMSFRRQLKQYTQEELYKNLKDLDPKATEIIHPNDNFRTIRALEVIYKTNKLFSKLKTMRELPYDVLWVGLTFKNRELHTKLIEKRAFAFCANGLIDEVKELQNKYGMLDLFKRTIGYAEVIDFLNNNIKLEDMIEKITLHTRQLVKRQMTWFRANKKIHWVYLDELGYEEAFKRVFNLMQEGSLAKTSIASVS
ncbi:MAG: tRNA (adenosine(37)-N6)-dimethylallyltransferase MiaA [Candidatus Melainabacteria bacterium RIFCSPHIGHO2_02_FULL_34_12]|nr:MAG: tRNA (adenosine(37)-N6)-dimethylallyltransferase MiaA [Candidatus Melainabacteria bacterium RIFCSPHIGHO2_02_FULL_34_12]